MTRIPRQQQTDDYRRLLDTQVYHISIRALRIGLRKPRKVIRTFVTQPLLPVTAVRRYLVYRRSLSLRRRLEVSGLVIPPLLLMGITSRCNLSCAGCYMQDRDNLQDREMTGEDIRSIVSQAAALGVITIVILGGEPLLRWKEIYPVTRSHPHIVFPLFTNGLLMNDRIVRDLARCTNIIPFISFEGFRSETDARRGKGVYDRLLSVCALLDARVPFFGCSVTVTRENIGTVLSEPFIRMLIGTGAGAIAYIQYVPVRPGTEHLVITPGQRQMLNDSIQTLNRTYPALFMAAPGDVERFGGCLAAGRGFLYISPSGVLEPCAMAPHRVADLRSTALGDALRSPFLGAIRDCHHQLKPYGHCPLRTDPAWVRQLDPRGQDPRDSPEDCSQGFLGEQRGRTS